MRLQPRPLGHAAVEFVRAARRLARFAADFVCGKQPIIAVKQRIFRRLRHHRSTQLLEADTEVVGRVTFDLAFEKRQHMVACTPIVELRHGLRGGRRKHR